jgi:hypothetical protein
MADVKFSEFDVGGEMQVGDIPVGLRTGQPTKNFQFDFPGAGIKDSSGNYLFEYDTAGALAVNHLKLISALTTNAPILTAAGTDTNIDIAITPKGTGALILDGLTWPTSDGAPNTFLFTDGSGNLAFTGASVATAIIGTANQVLANGTSGSMQTGNVTLTTPQDIAVTSIPTFAGLNLNGSTSGTLSLLATAITGTNTITFPAATGTVALTSQLPTPSALTRVDDTNVTLTLGGSPTVALLAATSLTLGWTGQLSLTRGGTNASLVASNGGIVYSTATAFAILSGTATANQVLLSGSSAAPAWSTATYPATTTINQLLYSSSANVITGLATANSAVLVTTSAGVPVFSGTMTDGQVIIGSTGATPVAATLTAGTNISIANASGTVTISATGSGGFGWTEITGTSQNMASNSGYIANNAGVVTFNLPVSSSIGDEAAVVGKGAGGWLIQCGGGQTVVVGSSTTSSGGSVASTHAKDSIYLVCTTANTEWTVLGAPQSSGLTIA